MTSAEQILSEIDGMHAAVRKVSREWEPADLSRIDAARIALETSLPEFREPLGVVPGPAANIPSDVRLRKAAEGLRDEISKLQFLVDAASAFVRSVASAQGQSYTLSGEIGPASPATSTAAYTG
jgi:hypothetical protein